MGRGPTAHERPGPGQWAGDQEPWPEWDVVWREREREKAHMQTKLLLRRYLLYRCKKFGYLTCFLGTDLDQ